MNNLDPKKTSHFFPCSGDYQHCAGKGVEGVFQLYNSCLGNVELSGPTLFQPMIKEISKFTTDNMRQHPDNYTVLLILTDGEIHDMEDTIDAIVAASTLAMSIIIIGVGNEKFANMVTLDSDDRKLRSSTGKIAKRDIV